MTPQLTAKEVRRRYAHIIDGGNMRWQRLPVVCRWERVGFNAGTLGWNFDVLEVTADTCIVTGDRPIDGNLEVNLDRMAGYEAEATRLLGERGAKDYSLLRGQFARKVMRYIRKLEETADARGAGRASARH